MSNSWLNWPLISAVVTRGHRVASGLNCDPRFPGGTLAMQQPFFARLGLELSAYHPGTLNLSIAPHCYHVISPRLTFRAVQWHPTEPAEDFSFFDCKLLTVTGEWVGALIYHPHSETKPEHFQSPNILEVLAPSILGITYGDLVTIAIDPTQMALDVVSPD